MLKLRKASFVLASAALLTGMLSACGTSNNNSNNGGSTSSAGTTNTTTNTSTNTNTSKDSGTNATANNSGNAAATDDASTKKITISIYYPTPDLVEKRALEDDKIKRFNEKYPNVTIVKSDWQYNPNEIGIKMGANEAPTLFNTYRTPRFAAENAAGRS